MKRTDCTCAHCRRKAWTRVDRLALPFLLSFVATIIAAFTVSGLVTLALCLVSAGIMVAAVILAPPMR